MGILRRNQNIVPVLAEWRNLQSRVVATKTTTSRLPDFVVGSRSAEIRIASSPPPNVVLQRFLEVSLRVCSPIDGTLHLLVGSPATLLSTQLHTSNRHGRLGAELVRRLVGNVTGRSKSDSSYRVKEPNGHSLMTIESRRDSPKYQLRGYSIYDNI
jgi:hypothetical protein